jgi:hypothetical protein
MGRFAALRGVDSLAPARLALRGNLRLLYRAASLAAWLCSLHQTLDFP